MQQKCTFVVSRLAKVYICRQKYTSAGRCILLHRPLFEKSWWNSWVLVEFFTQNILDTVSRQQVYHRHQPSMAEWYRYSFSSQWLSPLQASLVIHSDSGNHKISAERWYRRRLDGSFNDSTNMTDSFTSTAKISVLWRPNLCYFMSVHSMCRFQSCLFFFFGWGPPEEKCEIHTVLW